MLELRKRARRLSNQDICFSFIGTLVKAWERRGQSLVASEERALISLDVVGVQ